MALVQTLMLLVDNKMIQILKKDMAVILVLALAGPSSAKLHMLASPIQMESEGAVMSFEQAINKPVREYNLACDCALTGRTEEALTHLAKAAKSGIIDVAYIETDPDLDSIRKLSRYSGIIKDAKTLAEKGKKESARLAKEPEPQDIVLNARGVKNGKKTPLLVFLHGSGGSPKDLEQAFGPLLSTCGYKVYLPCGSVKVGFRADGKPGYTWEALKDSRKIVEAVKAMKDINPDQVYLAGFSAGGCMAYLAGLSYPDLFKGVVVFSGAFQDGLLPADDSGIKDGKPSFYIIHGNQDKMIPLALGKSARDYLSQRGYRVVFREFYGGHVLPQNYLDIIKKAVAWFAEKTAAK